MIKNLLFDLGGVIMDIRKENCVAAFEALGLRNAKEYFGDFSQKGPFYALERGDIGIDEFHDALRPELPEGVTDEQIDAAFTRFLIGIPPHRLAALEELRKTYKIYLLSNTNPIMWADFIKKDFTKAGRCREDYFDGMVVSFEANSLKPEEKIFRHTIEKLGIVPEETLFFDDGQVNLDGAAHLGFQTALVPEGCEFMDIINSL